MNYTCSFDNLLQLSICLIFPLTSVSFPLTIIHFSSPFSSFFPPISSSHSLYLSSPLSYFFISSYSFSSPFTPPPSFFPHIGSSQSLYLSSPLPSFFISSLIHFPLLSVSFPLLSSHSPLIIIRIYHECEGRIEKSVLRIAVWHHEGCRVMTSSDPQDGFFYPTLTRIMESFSCSSLFFFIQKSLTALRCNFT